MVKSKINKKIVYEEFKNIDVGDIDHETTVYEVNVVKYHKRVNIILGKENNDYENEKVIYYNIYLLNDDDSIRNKIGVFELSPSDNEIFINTEDIENIGNILWFSNLSEVDLSITSLEYESDMSDDVDKTSVASTYGDKVSNFNKIIINEETKELADKIRGNFTSNAKRHNWVQEFMKNMNYDVVDNEGNGDCFFCVIRDALIYTGTDISIVTMRNLLAKEIDEDLYINYKEQYEMYSTSLMNDKKKLKSLNKKYKLLEKETINLDDKNKKIKNMKEMEKIKGEHDKVKEEMKLSEELLQEFIYMSDIETVGEFRKFALSNSFWADTWVVSTIERILNIKCILLSSDAYEEGDKDNVIHCNQLNDDILNKKGEFIPDYYIIMDYNGYHYQLIRYGKKGIFKFNEIPFDLKNLILYKCLEGDNGPYNIIPDFAKMKRDKGVMKSKKYDLDLDNIYGSKTVFQIYNKSSDKLPGKGVGEKIEDSEITKYSELKKIKDWRRKLSHMWPLEIEINGDTFKTVEHYVQANKFVNYPDLYKQFTVDSKSTISLNPEKAILMGAANSSIRDKKYKIDPSYETRYSELLNYALRKKFIGNSEFKNLLKKTNDAKIMEYRRARTPRVMDELMKLRKEIIK